MSGSIYIYLYLSLLIIEFAWSVLNKKKPIRLKTGGFVASGDDRKDLHTLRTAKNIDDGSAV